MPVLCLDSLCTREDLHRACAFIDGIFQDRLGLSRCEHKPWANADSAVLISGMPEAETYVTDAKDSQGPIMHNIGVSGRLRTNSASEQRGVSQTLIPLNVTSSLGRQTFACGKNFRCLYLILDSGSSLQHTYGSDRLIAAPAGQRVDLQHTLGRCSQVSAMYVDE